MGMFDEILVEYTCDSCSWSGEICEQTKLLEFPSMIRIFSGKYVGHPKEAILKEDSKCPGCGKELEIYIAITNGFVVYVGFSEEKAIATKLLWKDSDFKALSVMNDKYAKLLEDYRRLRIAILDISRELLGETSNILPFKKRLNSDTSPENIAKVLDNLLKNDESEL